MARFTVINAPLGAFYGEALTTATSRKATTIPPGTKEILANCNGDWRIQLAPPLEACFKTANSEVDFTDYTTEATDKSTSTSVTLTSLDTAANGAYWYVVCAYPFGGIWVDVDDANDQNATMTGYYKAGATWTNISITDGSNSSGTLAQDGAITWATPSSWQSQYLSDLFPNATTLSTLPIQARNRKLYVVRFQVSVALGTAVTLDEVAPLVDATASSGYPHAYFSADTDYQFNILRSEVGSIDYYDSAGSKTLWITYIKEKKEEKFS